MLNQSESINIGSGADNTIVVKDAVAEKYHATIYRLSNGQLKVIDKNTKYGSYINGVRINEAILSENESLQIGYSKFSYQDLIQQFENNDDSSEPVETAIESDLISSYHNVIEVANEQNDDTELMQIELPETSSDDIKKVENRTPHRNSQLLYFIIIPIIILLFFSMGNYIAARNKIKLVIVPFNSYIPFIPVTENAFNTSPLLADCVGNEVLMTSINESTPEIIQPLSDSLLIFGKICDVFEKIKQDQTANKRQRLMTSFLKENICLSLLIEEATSKTIGLVCIGKNNKFSIKHYINKRYNLQFASSYEADIFTYTDQQNKVWIPFDIDEPHPGKTSFNLMSKSVLYHFDTDRCEPFHTSVSM